MQLTPCKPFSNSQLAKILISAAISDEVPLIIPASIIFVCIARTVSYDVPIRRMLTSGRIEAAFFTKMYATSITFLRTHM